MSAFKMEKQGTLVLCVCVCVFCPRLITGWSSRTCASVGGGYTPPNTDGDPAGGGRTPVWSGYSRASPH